MDIMREDVRLVCRIRIGGQRAIINFVATNTGNNFAKGEKKSDVDLDS